MSLDSLLDFTLDDLADMPEFKPFPNGAYRCAISWEEKTINGKNALELKAKLLETVEMSNPMDDQPKAGAETSVLYMLDNEFAQGKLKAILLPICTHLNVTKLRDAINESQNLEVLLVTKTRMDKDKVKSYTDIVNLQVI